MSVTNEEVKHIANLARLHFTDEEVEKLTGEMNKILDYVDKLHEIDTTDVEPLKHITDMNTALRTDETKEQLSHEEALKNAPNADSDYFRVPRVLE